MTELGFVGLGKMGSRMVVRLLAAGHAVQVFDPVAQAVAAAVQRGATAAASARAVADAADVVLCSLPSPAILQEVMTGELGLSGGGRVSTVIDLSTTGPRVTQAVAAAITAGGRIGYVDCPVSGGVAGAENGTLTMMVACSTALFNETSTILGLMGRLFHVGQVPGQAQTLKLANNLLSAAALAVTAEVMAMGVKAGLDPQVMLDVINVSSGRNSATLDKLPRAVLPRTFDFGFSNGLSFKDVRLCTDEAEAMGVPMVVGSAVRQMLSVTNSLFGSDADCTELVKLVESWAGVTVARPKKIED